MTGSENNPTDVDINQIDNAMAAITTLARTHGITGEPDPIDAFADAASRLADAGVTFDQVERLLVKIARAGLLTDDRRFALHTLYLRQKGDAVQSDFMKTAPSPSR